MYTLALLAVVGPAVASPPVTSAAGSTFVPTGPGPGKDAALPVVGGDDVQDPMDWPDVAGVSDGRQVFCTGTLIAPDVVLTAGHCVLGTHPAEVILGTNDYDQPGEVIAIDDWFEYPRSQSGGFDVGVLVLAEPSSYAPRVIATDCVRDDIDDGVDAIVVGYGATDPNATRYSSDLQEGNTAIEDAECNTSLLGCASDVMPDGELTAGFVGASVCSGDSGGPLYLPTDRGTFLVGVTSRGAIPCGNGGIFGRPDNPTLFNWIEDVTERRLPRPLCLEPSARPLYFVKNHPAWTQIDPGSDASPYEYDVVTQPVFGSAFVDASGQVAFTPERGFRGNDQVIVRVRDHEGWTGEVAIPIEHVSRGEYHDYTGEKAPCGCGHAPTGGSFAFAVGLAALLRVRRRSVERPRDLW